MASNMRKNHDTAFKARVALETLKEEKTMAQLSSEYGAHPNQIRQWRQKLLDELPGVFSDRRQKKDKETEEVTSELYRQWRHEVALVNVWQWLTAIDQTRCFTTGILGRHACMVHSYRCEALPTMYRRP